MWKKRKMVMLPTKNKATIVINPSTNKIQYSDPSQNVEYYTDAGFTVFDLYIVSNETIKEGDWVLGGLGGTDIKQYGKYFAEDWKKIITATDTSLSVHWNTQDHKSLPQISQSFVELYIREYNKENVISDVLVEYDDELTTDGDWEKYSTLHINSDNTINIKLLKECWTREEVVKLLKDISQDAISEPEIFITGICFDKNKFNKWIEQNL